MYWWQILLYPFAILYDLVTRFRNHLYNIGQSPSIEFETNIISVGNLAVGGTGKTPHTEFLIKHLVDKKYRITTLSRGYGRKTKGFRIADGFDTVKTVGDEPLYLFENYSNEIVVAVGEDRALAIPKILINQPDNDVILLDDAFQHRSVKPGLSILLTAFQRPFYEDFVLPGGLLRESRKGARRADIIIVTKCPKTLSGSERAEIRKKLKIYNSSCDIFFTSNKYLDLKPLGEKQSRKSKVLGLAGIANPSQFFEDLHGLFDVVGTLSFRDHHNYTLKDVKRIISHLQTEEAMLVCTEKDAIKLRTYKELQDYACFSLPVRILFLADEDLFLQRINSSVRQYNRDI